MDDWRSRLGAALSVSDPVVMSGSTTSSRSISSVFSPPHNSPRRRSVQPSRSNPGFAGSSSNSSFESLGWALRGPGETSVSSAPNADISSPLVAPVSSAKTDPLPGDVGEKKRARHRGHRRGQSFSAIIIEKHGACYPPPLIPFSEPACSPSTSTPFLTLSCIAFCGRAPRCQWHQRWRRRGCRWCWQEAVAL